MTWWDDADFDNVVSLAVTELYQDSIDRVVVEESLQALPRVVAETLRNIHFMEIREQRDEARRSVEILGDAMDRQRAFNVQMEVQCLPSFLEAFALYAERDWR